MRLRTKESDRTREVKVELSPEPHLEVDGKALSVTQFEPGEKKVEFELEGQKVTAEGRPVAADSVGPWIFTVNGEEYRVEVEVMDRGGTTHRATHRAPVAPPSEAPIAGTGWAVSPPMPGKVLEVLVRDGAEVHKGDPLLVLEAMKMRNEVASPGDGVVRGIMVTPGTNVKAKDVLLRIEPRAP